MGEVFETATVSVDIPSLKGNLSAVVHRPKTDSDQLAILCPGFVDSKDYAGLVGLAEALCERGYTVVRFDPTGTWASDGTIDDYSTTQYLVDIRHVLDFMLAGHPFSHVLLGGHSRGAGTTLSYAATDRRISAVLAIMPSSGRPLDDETRLRWKAAGARTIHRDLPGNPTQFRTFKVPYAFQLDRDRHDVAAEVRRLSIPVLFVAGERDTLILPEYVQALFDQANEPKRFIVVPRIGHDYRHLAIGAAFTGQRLHQPSHTAQTYLRLAGLGFLGTFLYDFLLFESLRLLPAQAASTINYVWPIMVVLFAVLILGERLTVRKFLALSIAFLGVAIVITDGQLSALVVGSGLGVILCLAAAASYSLFSVLDTQQPHDKFVSTAWYFFFGSIYGLAAVLLWSQLPPISLGQLGGLAYLGILTSGLGYVCWFLALRYGETTKVSTMIFLTPFVALIFIALLLHEAILPSSILGLAVIVSGILLSHTDHG